MKRYVVLLCIVMVLWGHVSAQTDPQLGHYMFLQTTYNPAAAGDGDLMRVAGMHRMQFTGMRNAPMTTYFTFSSPFVIGKTKHAAGVRFLNDMYGLFTNQTFYVQYAYRHKIGNGHLAVGVDLGFANLGFKTDSVNLSQIPSELQDGGFFSETDELVPMGNGEKGASGMGFDMGVGVYYSAPKWWIGASYSHLTQPKLEWSDLSEIKLVGTLYVAGGYNWRLRNKDWMLKPSVMMMTDFPSCTMLRSTENSLRIS